MPMRIQREDIGKTVRNIGPRNNTKKKRLSLSLCSIRGKSRCCKYWPSWSRRDPMHLLTRMSHHLLTASRRQSWLMKAHISLSSTLEYLFCIRSIRLVKPYSTSTLSYLSTVLGLNYRIYGGNRVRVWHHQFCPPKLQPTVSGWG